MNISLVLKDAIESNEDFLLVPAICLFHLLGGGGGVAKEPRICDKK